MITDIIEHHEEEIAKLKQDRIAISEQIKIHQILISKYRMLPAIIEVNGTPVYEYKDSLYVWDEKRKRLPDVGEIYLEPWGHDVVRCMNMAWRAGAILGNEKLKVLVPVKEAGHE